MAACFQTKSKRAPQIERSNLPRSRKNSDSITRLLRESVARAIIHSARASAQQQSEKSLFLTSFRQRLIGLANPLPSQKLGPRARRVVGGPPAAHKTKADGAGEQLTCQSGWARGSPGSRHRQQHAVCATSDSARHPRSSKWRALRQRTEDDIGRDI